MSNEKINLCDVISQCNNNSGYYKIPSGRTTIRRGRTEKSSGSIKIEIDDKDAADILSGKQVGYFILVDKEEFENKQRELVGEVKWTNRI